MKISEYDALTKEYESDIKKLQKRCPHKKRSEWMKECWALGHSTGYIVRVCDNCNKIVGRKRDTSNFNTDDSTPHVFSTSERGKKEYFRSVYKGGKITTLKISKEEHDRRVKEWMKKRS